MDGKSQVLPASYEDWIQLQLDKNEYEKKKIMSTAAAQELGEKFGFESLFGTNVSKGKFSRRKLSFNNLIHSLKRNRGDVFYYDFGDYTLGRDKYKNSDGIEYLGRVRGNLMNGEVSLLQVSYKIEIDYGRKDYESLDYTLNAEDGFSNIKRLVYTIRIPYVNPISNSFDDTYALTVEFFNYDHFKFVYNKILGYNIDLPEAETQIFYSELFARYSSISELKWLYQTVPDFILKYYRADEDLMSDIAYLISYDIDPPPLPSGAGYVLTWFTDASAPIIRALYGLKDPKYAYNYFVRNPQQAIRIYSGLEGSFRAEFTGFLSFLAKYYGTDDIGKERKERPVFHLGKDYSLDSDLGQDSGTTIFLEETQMVPTGRTVTFPGGKDNQGVEHDYYRKKVVSSDDYHPMKLVMLYDVDGGEAEQVVALDVKRLSDEAEWDEVVRIVAITISIVAILGSAGVIAAGTAGVFVTAVAFTELAVESVNLINLLRLDPGETDEFKEFWDKVSLFTGVVTIGSSLYKGIIKYGPRLLNKLRFLKTVAAERIRKALLEIFLKINLEFNIASVGRLNFKVVLPETTALVSSNYKMTPEVFERLFGNGIIVGKAELTPVISGSGDVYGLIYRQQLIFRGTQNQVKNFVKRKVFTRGKIKPANIRFLDELAEEVKIGIRREGSTLIWKNASGREMQWSKLDEKANLKRIKDAEKRTFKRKDLGENFEARGARAIFRISKKNNDVFVDYSNDVNGRIPSGKFGDPFGDIDASTYKYIFEIKRSLAKDGRIKSLYKQLSKYLPEYSESSEKYLNAFNKKVVVLHKRGFIDESHELIKELKSKGVIFVNGIQDLKKLY